MVYGSLLAHAPGKRCGRSVGMADRPGPAFPPPYRLWPDARHRRHHVVAAVAVEDTAALGLGLDPLDGGDGRTCLHAVAKHAGARPGLAQYRRVRPAGLCHRGFHSGIADPRRSDPCRRCAWRLDGNQFVARTLQRTERMAMDLHVPGRVAADLSDQPAWPQPRHRCTRLAARGCSKQEGFAPFSRRLTDARVGGRLFTLNSLARRGAYNEP